MTEGLYKKQEVAGKGMGCVATREIKKGSLVLRERPALFGQEKQTVGSMVGDFTMMTREDQKTQPRAVQCL